MERVARFIAVLMSAISNCSLYSKEHKSLDELSQKAFSLLDELLRGKEGVEFMIVGNDLIVNKVPFRKEGIQGKNLVRRLKKKGVTGVNFLPGVTTDEIRELIIDMSDPHKDLTTYPHIETGSVDVRTSASQSGAVLDPDGVAHLKSEQVERLKELYYDISPFRQLNVAGIEEVVVTMISAFKRQASILQLISPVKSYSEYTYTHAMNVAVLALFQAESLGVKGQLLHDLGIAALLHDVGKIFVSKDVLEKQGALEEREWEEMRKHTVYGARYLSRIDALPHIAPIVALEHHMRYDGQGYPKLKTRENGQLLCSQMVALSDFFDALRSKRPYKKDWQVKEILSLMTANAGKEFNTFLVDNFTRILSLALKAA